MLGMTVGEWNACLSYHVINQAMLIPNVCLLKLLSVALLIHVCKNLEETAIICLQDGVFGG